ncbi:MAG: FeoA family protein [Archaeoglobales archaeon]|nr:FeoA family protein [Archaeoglobales archaeon]
MKTLENSEGRVTVKGIVGGKGLLRRLFDMGIYPSQKIEVLTNRPQVVVKLGDTKIALSRGIAKKIVVEEDPVEQEEP